MNLPHLELELASFAISDHLLLLESLTRIATDHRMLGSRGTRTRIDWSLHGFRALVSLPTPVVRYSFGRCSKSKALCPRRRGKACHHYRDEG